MEKAIIGIVSAVVGSFITLFGKNVISKRETQSNEINKFYDNLLKRVESLERDIDTLKIKVNRWTARYWALYKWLIKSEEIQGTPPAFHKMNMIEINKEFEIENDYENVETSS